MAMCPESCGMCSVDGTICEKTCVVLMEGIPHMHRCVTHLGCSESDKFDKRKFNAIFTTADVQTVRDQYKAMNEVIGTLAARELAALRVQVKELTEANTGLAKELDESSKKILLLKSELSVLQKDLKMTEDAAEDTRKKNEQLLEQNKKLLEQIKKWGTGQDLSTSQKEERRQVAAYIRNVAEAIENNRIDGIDWEWREGGFAIGSTIKLKIPPKHIQLNLSGEQNTVSSDGKERKGT